MSVFKPLYLVFLTVALLLVACDQSSSDWSGRDDIVSTDAGDQEIKDAVDLARVTLPQFWEALSQPDTNDHSFSIKVGLAADNGGTEHIWVENVSRNGEEITGTLQNIPMHLSDFEIGDSVSFSKTQVTDWQFVRDGKSEGNHVTKVLLNRMSSEQAHEVRTILGWD